jgi:hypothetical protein
LVICFASFNGHFWSFGLRPSFVIESFALGASLGLRPLLVICPLGIIGSLVVICFASFVVICHFVICFMSLNCHFVLRTSFFVIGYNHPFSFFSTTNSPEFVFIFQLVDIAAGADL